MNINSKEELFQLLEGLQNTINSQAEEIQALKAGNANPETDPEGNENPEGGNVELEGGNLEPESTDEIAQLLEL